MEYMNKIKKMLCKELEEYGEQKSISASDVEMIHKLTSTIKNLDKIEMLEGDGYSGHYPMYDDGVSYARGRGRYAKRDSMGRYSSDTDGNYSDEYSDRGYDRRYSRGDAKDHMMNKLGEMMRNADPNEREALEEAMRKIERA
nr:MAG TPA: hypothetical protein [Caudoviricetes sp.]